MKTKYEKVNYEWLTLFTGDPFIDAGGYALKKFSEKNPELDILELIEKVTAIYVDKWGGKLNPFFLNSKITQPAFDFKRKKEETKKYFLSLLNESAANKKGICRIFGKEATLFPAGRDNSILSGSSGFINFHHGFEAGIMLSKEALIRLHFLPLGCEFLQGKIAVIHSSQDSIASEFAFECCQRNLDAIGMNISTGILKSESKTPGTALFIFADKIIKDAKELLENDSPSIILYHFTNFGASPEVNIYVLPSPIFKFYRITRRPQYKDEWNAFIRKYFSNSDFKRAAYDENNEEFIYNDKKEQTIIQEDQFKYWRNTIYEKLINNQSITSSLLKHSIDHKLSFELIKIYEIHINNMKRETIEKIEQMADFILASNDEDGIKKAIVKLNLVRNSYLLRRFVIKDIVAKYYNEGNKDAIVTVNDYAEYLFPDTNSWQETRDVLLIAIYQKLHEKNILIEAEIPEETEES